MKFAFYSYMKNTLVIISLFVPLCVHAQSTLFSTDPAQRFVPVKISVESDFKKALSAKKDADPYGEPDLSRLLVDATITDLQNNRSFGAKIRARGNSVLTDPEANFPKLKIEIEKAEEIDSTLFSGQRNFRINTHISDKITKTGLTTYGRLIGDNAPRREGLVYKLAESLGLITPLTRFAEITYKDAITEKVQTNQALIIETDKKIAQRYNGEIILDLSEITMRPVVKPSEAALFFAFHKLIGNEDVALKMYEPNVMETENNRELWNTFLVKMNDGSVRPVVYDLDLATGVNGRNSVIGKEYLNKDFDLMKPETALFVTRFAKLRQKIADQNILAAVRLINSKMPQLREIIQASPVDNVGKKLILQHLELFRENAEKVLSLKIIAAEGVRFYRKADIKSGQKTKVSREDDLSLPLRPGTPVKVLSEEGGFLKVAIMDIRKDLKESESAIGFIDKKSVIADTLPESLLGSLNASDM